MMEKPESINLKTISDNIQQTMIATRELCHRKDTQEVRSLTYSTLMLSTSPQVKTLSRSFAMFERTIFNFEKTI